jgi:hypothetical protein
VIQRSCTVPRPPRSSFGRTISLLLEDAPSGSSQELSKDMTHHGPDPTAAPSISVPPRSRGRVAVITGAARAMGRAHAIGLAREGCDLVNSDILGDLPEGTRATPMGYAWVKPEDVTAAVLFLLSDEARFISGDTLSIDAADFAHWT